jgi:hypothetical protein
LKIRLTNEKINLHYIQNLQIVAGLEATDGQAKEDLWERPEGGGRTRVSKTVKSFQKAVLIFRQFTVKWPETVQRRRS